MVLKVSNPNNVKIYTVSGSSLTNKIPDWLARSKKKALKNDREWQTRIELIQDFEFPEAGNRIKISPDGEYCLATGVYKPQLRVFELSQMSIKFERHTEAENVNFLVLSDDWTKTFGRDLSYHRQSCDLLVCGASSQVYRINLEQGSFLKPFETDATGINTCAINPAHQLFAFGSENGTVEFWDPRSKSRAGLLSPTVKNTDGFEITSMSYRNDGLGMALGTSTGQTMIFDLRLSQPLLTKHQQYDLPIKKLAWIEPNVVTSADNETARVLSADSKSIKIWDSLSGDPHCSIEPTVDINDVCIYPDSGLVFATCEATEIYSYFIPSLGPAPKFASFLENLTEELEESKAISVYEDYKFVTKIDLENIGLEHLIGTNMLKAYMHGFFIDLRLYERAKAVANPFAYDEYRQNQIKKKLDEQRESRIRTSAKLPKINKKLAIRLMEQSTTGKEAASGADKAQTQPKSKPSSDLLSDSRFKDLFTDDSFEVNEESIEYKQLHPTVSKKKINRLTKMAEAYSDDSSENED
ncbi:hypothetical protein BB561_002751 [Smittium simulii]|uniref:Uncharacterized protein n=1 Tax=Smittium simulii TaxID=133385 RepID=A0A2T9YPC5_9FUNG|nr:hypothetical protein BB561_002751 [Smittium simulii]